VPIRPSQQDVADAILSGAPRLVSCTIASGRDHTHEEKVTVGYGRPNQPKYGYLRLLSPSMATG